MTREEDSAATDRQVRQALALHAYRQNQVRIVDRDLAGFRCLVASRRGLFAVSPEASKLVAYGQFFGLRRSGHLLYAFEACDLRRGPSRLGRVLRLRLDGDRLCDETVLATGLDNRCHQLALIGPHICVVDTANQAVVRLTLDGGLVDTQVPFGDPVPDGRHHMNAIARVDGATLVMLHNGGEGPSRPSELAWLDDAWRVVRRETLPGYGCHDIIADQDGLLWHCGSMDGELLNSAGLRAKVSDRLTRGLAITRDSILVGTSRFAVRRARTEVGGSVLFLDRQLARVAEVEVAGAPTEIALL